ncbi:hypothetical protein PRIPAC_92350 [Pristionchus pacificus]|uniref:Uncharacterized protein n=1 Tax=Pristionchus pacificus TaxID=54126 RepID=A0A2A6CE65_PRIPA|nr:hypothetical protein PRIPAC_92350 [Pristionchus pacificus]|eukprot:PDM76409.1 hypothetical protein PRIPAC_40013 [Pristionchus pacificus]
MASEIADASSRYALLPDPESPADSPTRAAAAAGRMATKTAAAPATPATRHVSMTEAMAKEYRSHSLVRANCQSIEFGFKIRFTIRMKDMEKNDGKFKTFSTDRFGVSRVAKVRGWI